MAVPAHSSAWCRAPPSPGTAIGTAACSGHLQEKGHLVLRDNGRTLQSPQKGFLLLFASAPPFFSRNHTAHHSRSPPRGAEHPLPGTSQRCGSGWDRARGVPHPVPAGTARGSAPHSETSRKSRAVPRDLPPLGTTAPARAGAGGGRGGRSGHRNPATPRRYPSAAALIVSLYGQQNV